MKNVTVHESRFKLIANDYISQTIHIKTMKFICFLTKETTGFSGMIISYQRDPNKSVFIIS